MDGALQERSKSLSSKHFSCSRVVPFFIDSIFCHEAVRCPISDF